MISGHFDFCCVKHKDSVVLCCNVLYGIVFGCQAFSVAGLKLCNSQPSSVLSVFDAFQV